MYLMPSATQAPAWSASARTLASVVCLEAAFAVLVLAQGAPGIRLALGAGLAAVVTLPLIIRAQMPMAAKTLLAVASITATLAVAAGADLLGLRSVEQAVVTAPIPGAPAAIETIAPSTATARPAYLTLRGTGDPIADQLADDLAVAMRGVSSGGDVPQIDGTIAQDAAGFALRWAVMRGRARRRCGDVRVFGEDSGVAVTAFRDALAGAIDASQSGQLACY